MPQTRLTIPPDQEIMFTHRRGPTSIVNIARHSITLDVTVPDGVAIRVPPQLRGRCQGLALVRMPRQRVFIDLPEGRVVLAAVTHARVIVQAARNLGVFREEIAPSDPYAAA